MRIRLLTLLLASTIASAVAYVHFSDQDSTGAAPPEGSDEPAGQPIRDDHPEAGSIASEPILGPDGEAIVFQVSHANFAWGRVSEGFFINARGEVWRFDSFDREDQVRYPLALPPNPRHADLLKSFGAHPKMVATVPAATLAAQQALAQAARNAPLVCGQAAMDAGGIGYQAWLMSGDGVYSSIRLGAEGDVSCRSLSPAGQQVKRWLESTTGMRSVGTALPARICKARPCSPGADCFSVTYCESVPNCNWCDGSTVCVEGPDGKKHCSIGDRWRCNDDPCRCFGHAVCPGGDGDCRKLAGGAVTCTHP
jgi:hypothetical protein